MKTSASRRTKAAKLLAEYDFDGAIAELLALSRDAAAPKDERSEGLLLLLEIYVDSLADDDAAFAL